MAGVAEAYQHLFNDRLPYAFRLTRRVAVCNKEFFSGEMTPLIVIIQLSFIQ